VIVRYSSQRPGFYHQSDHPPATFEPLGVRNGTPGVLCAIDVVVSYEELRALGAWYGHTGISAGHIEVARFVQDVVRTNLAQLVPPVRVKVKVRKPR